MPYVTSTVLMVEDREEQVDVSTWSELEVVLERLGEQEFGRLLLFGQQVRRPAVMTIEYDVSGGETGWSCGVHRSDRSDVLLNPKAKRIEVEGVRLPLGLVRKAAKTFFESGKRKRSLVWGRAAQSLVKMLGQPGRDFG